MTDLSDEHIFFLAQRWYFKCDLHNLFFLCEQEIKGEHVLIPQKKNVFDWNNTVYKVTNKYHKEYSFDLPCPE